MEEDQNYMYPYSRPDAEPVDTDYIEEYGALIGDIVGGYDGTAVDTDRGCLIFIPGLTIDQAFPEDE